MRRSKRRYLLNLLRNMQFRQHHRTWVRGNIDAVSLAQTAQLRFTIDPSITLVTMGCFTPENMGKYAFTGDEIDRRVQDAAKLCLEKVTPCNGKGIPTS